MVCALYFIYANILALAIVLNYACQIFLFYSIPKKFFLSWKRQIRIHDMIHIINDYKMNILKISDWNDWFRFFSIKLMAYLYSDDHFFKRVLYFLYSIKKISDYT